MAIELKDRCAGVLIGLAAGDRNGGPIRLAVRLLESVLEKKEFCQKEIVDKYSNYFKGPPHDIEKAFDTGHTLYSVFKYLSEGKTIAVASEAVQKKYGSIGVGAAHRNVVLSMASFLNQSNLVTAVHEETYITHANNISYEVSLFVNVLCRKLIEGMPWAQAIDLSLNSMTEPAVRDAVTCAATCDQNSLSPDGYAPNVLRASLYFLHHGTNFENTLNPSLSFAGPANYCPVLVGAMAGARYGSKVILQKNHDGRHPFLAHCSEELLSRVLSLAETSGNLW